MNQSAQAQWAKPPKPSRPIPQKIANAVAPIFRQTCPTKISAINEIVRLAGSRPNNWQKPKFGGFEYWLAHQCGWISECELVTDTAAYKRRQKLARQTSYRFSKQRFTWTEEPRYDEPQETDEYVPQINMKLVSDRNLTDSARRIALFVLRHAYQDCRKKRFIGMTVSFVMKGLSLSRRTVQRSLTLLETRGYFRCEVAKGDTTRMCVGLIIHLMGSLLPKHHQEKWPAKSKNVGNPAASLLPQKQIQFNKSIYNAKHRISRLTWALKCMNAITDRVLQEFQFSDFKLDSPETCHSLKGGFHQQPVVLAI